MSKPDLACVHVFAGSLLPDDSTPPPNKRAPKALRAPHGTVTCSRCTQAAFGVVLITHFLIVCRCGV